MARKRKVESDDDAYTDHDASFEPKKKRGKVNDRKPAKRQPRQSNAKGKGKKHDISDEYMNDAETVDSSPEILQTRPHPLTLHVIAHAAPLREALLRWYERVHASRGMPWRKPYDPSWDAEQKAQRAYEVWVSEIMLQQTQVATVIPYYNKWMDKFPTIRDLAAADIDIVNALWKGLGYYSRAARLLSGAQKAVAEFNGRLPDNAKDMENKIPGIGRYSAGAICSIAYNECAPVLDGNVHRLLSRVLALHAPPKAKQTLDILWAGASAFVKDADRPGDLNQALIELGSTVCKARDPSCDGCPLQHACAAYALQHSGINTSRREDDSASEVGRVNGTKYATADQPSPVPDIEELCTLCEPVPDGSPVTVYPMKVEKKKAREELDIVNVIEWRNSSRADLGERWFLLVRRPEGGLLAGLHEFPTASNVPVTTSASAQAEMADTILSALLVSPPARSSCWHLQGSDGRSEEGRESSGSGRRQSESHDGPARTTRPKPKPTLVGSNVPANARASASTGGGLRVVKIVPAGDVLHIFSHIRKTYRVQWVVLEDGSADGPPPLVVQEPELPSGGAVAAISKRSKGKGSRKNRTATISRSQQRPPEASPDGAPWLPPPRQRTQWVLLDAVADANIGTGVLKVWRQVRALWEGDDAASDGSGP